MAATHWAYMDLLPAFGAVPVDRRVVVDRNRITAGGVTAGIDFGLRVVAESSADDDLIEVPAHGRACAGFARSSTSTRYSLRLRFLPDPSTTG